MQEKKRIYFWDYLRAFIVLIMVTHHSVLAYCERFAMDWFIKDVNRSGLLDGIYLFNHSFMMPFLFMISGVFLIPSLVRRGVIGYFKERFMRLVVPFIICVPIMPTLIIYPRFLLNNPGIGLWEFVTQHYLKLEPQTLFGIEYQALGGSFQITFLWFIQYLFWLSLLVIIIHKIAPCVLNWLKNHVQYCFNNIKTGLGIFIFTSIAIITFCDFYWGRFAWVNPGKLHLFVAPCAHVLLIIYYLFIGIGFGLSDMDDNLQKLATNYQKLLFAMIVSGACYIVYSKVYFWEAYSFDLQRHLHSQGDWSAAWPIIKQSGPYMLMRTALRGLFCCMQCLAITAVFVRFCDHGHKWLHPIALCSYGVYLFHEPFITFTNYWLYGGQLPVFSFLMALSISVTAGVTITWFLRKITFVRKVL